MKIRLMEGEKGLGKGFNRTSWNWSTIIATAGTAVLAITALITVYLTIASWKVQQETTRPFFVLKESPKVELGNDLSIELKFNNVGVHPAVNLSSKTIIFGEKLSAEPVYSDEASIVNEIPKDISSSLVLTIPSYEIYTEQSTIEPYYVVVNLQYTDPIINRAYNQTIYMKWNGVWEGKLKPIVHVQVEERNKIIEYFQEYNTDPKMRNGT